MIQFNWEERNCCWMILFRNKGFPGMRNLVCSARWSAPWMFVWILTNMLYIRPIRISHNTQALSLSSTVDVTIKYKKFDTIYWSLAQHPDVHSAAKEEKSWARPPAGQSESVCATDSLGLLQNTARWQCQRKSHPPDFRHLLFLLWAKMLLRIGLNVFI